MNDTLDLEQRLHDLATAVPPPETSVEQDLERGRRRLRRIRWLVSGGAAAGVAAIVLGAGLAGAGLDGDGGTSTPAPATQQKASDKPKPQHHANVEPLNGAQLLQTYRDVLADHLDPSGTHLQKKPDNLQSGDGLGTKLGWSTPGQEGLGMVEIFVGDGWGGFTGADCQTGATCSQKTVDGINAQIVTWDGQTTVVVRRPDGTVAITVNALFGNNSLVPVEGMDIPVDDIIRAAADERIAQPSRAQQLDAVSSMFPDVPDLSAPGPQRVPEQSTRTRR